MAKLTTPQKLLLLRSMRGLGMIEVSRQRWRTAHNLVAKGYFYQGSDGTFSHTQAGLEALLFDRKMEDFHSGSMASMENVQEVEYALAHMVRMARLAGAEA